MKQEEVDKLVYNIDKLQAKYWTRMKKSKLFVVDTSYLLAKNALPKHSPIILPYQVSLELHFLKRRMCNRVENVEKKLNYNSNIIFQNAETRKVCKKMFQIKKGDNDGCILASAIYLKQCYPFRKVILLTNDKELKLRCKLFGIETS